MLHCFLNLTLILMNLSSCAGPAGIGAGARSRTASVVGAALSGWARLVVCRVGLDASDREALEKENPGTVRKIERDEPLSTTDVKIMNKAGLSDDVMIRQMEATHSVFHLSRADIIDLKKAHVSQRVIDHMIQTGEKV